MMRQRLVILVRIRCLALGWYGINISRDHKGRVRSQKALQRPISMLGLGLLD